MSVVLNHYRYSPFYFCPQDTEVTKVKDLEVTKGQDSEVTKVKDSEVTNGQDLEVTKVKDSKVTTLL